MVSLSDFDDGDDDRYSSVSAVYRYYTSEGALLYIGRTNDMHIRDLAHYTKASWRGNASFLFGELFPREDIADLIEAHRITEFLPEFNIKIPFAGEMITGRTRWYAEKMGGAVVPFATFWASVYIGPKWTPPAICDAPAWEEIRGTSRKQGVNVQRAA